MTEVLSVPQPPSSGICTPPKSGMSETSSFNSDFVNSNGKRCNSSPPIKLSYKKRKFSAKRDFPPGCGRFAPSVSSPTSVVKTEFPSSSSSPGPNPNPDPVTPGVLPQVHEASPQVDNCADSSEALHENEMEVETAAENDNGGDDADVGSDNVNVENDTKEEVESDIKVKVEVEDDVKVEVEDDMKVETDNGYESGGDDMSREVDSGENEEGAELEQGDKDSVMDVQPLTVCVPSLEGELSPDDGGPMLFGPVSPFMSMDGVLKPNAVSATRDFPVGCGRYAEPATREECLKKAEALANGSKKGSKKSKKGGKKGASKETEENDEVNSKPEEENAVAMKENAEDETATVIEENASEGAVNMIEETANEEAITVNEENAEEQVLIVVKEDIEEEAVTLVKKSLVSKKSSKNAKVSKQKSKSKLRSDDSKKDDNQFEAESVAAMPENVTSINVQQGRDSDDSKKDESQCEAESVAAMPENVTPINVQQGRDSDHDTRYFIGLPCSRNISLDMKSKGKAIVSLDDDENTPQGKKDSPTKNDSKSPASTRSSKHASASKRNKKTPSNGGSSGSKQKAASASEDTDSKKKGISSSDDADSKKTVTSASDDTDSKKKGASTSHVSDTKMKAPSACSGSKGKALSVKAEPGSKKKVAPANERSRKKGEQSVSFALVPYDIKPLVEVAPDEDAGATTRLKVREVMRLFGVLFRKFLQEEEAHSKEPGQRPPRRPDIRASQILKENNRWVNLGKQILGRVPGVEVGDVFHYRIELCIVGLHRQSQGGIDYLKNGKQIIATSVVAAKGDDVDTGDVLVYKGQGGFLPGERRGQGEDQKMERGNLSLKNCIDLKSPVRVIRGLKGAEKGGNDSKSKCGITYSYDGLYLVEKYWDEKGPNGHKVFKFQMRRIPGQPDLPWKIVEDVEKMKSSVKVRVGLRMRDISHGKENRPIPVVNTVDDETAPANFEYTSTMMYPSWYDPKPHEGCDCVDGCSDSDKCYCAVKNGGELPFNYNGAIVEAKPIIYECGPACKCPPTCHNRVSQHGLKIELEVFKTESRGWGVRALSTIPSGSFVCEYTGELMSDAEAEKRTGNDEYLFDIGSTNDQSLWDGLSDLVNEQPSNAITEVVEDIGYTIDAYKYGGVGRFINHSCSPNLYAQNVLYDHDDKTLPHIMLFAAENIPPLQELSYHYNYKLGQVRDANGIIKKKECYCGSEECEGRLY